jgi:hypothetical protein
MVLPRAVSSRGGRYPDVPPTVKFLSRVNMKCAFTAPPRPQPCHPARRCVDERGNVLPRSLPILASWSDAPECTIANILKAPAPCPFSPSLAS